MSGTDGSPAMSSESQIGHPGRRRATIQRRVEYDGRRHSDKKGMNVPIPDKDSLQIACADRVIYDVQRRRIGAETARHGVRDIINSGWLAEDYFKEALRGNVRLDDIKSLQHLRSRCRKAMKDAAEKVAKEAENPKVTAFPKT